MPTNKAQYKQALAHRNQPIRKIKVVLNGFWYLLKYDYSVSFQVFISLCTLVVSLLLNQYLNLIILLVVTGYMLSMEIMNTCIELLCDYHQTGYDPKIKIIKDVSAVASGISVVIWTLVVIYEIYTVFVYFS